jgi:hypothetical protein
VDGIIGDKLGLVVGLTVGDVGLEVGGTEGE